MQYATFRKLQLLIIVGFFSASMFAITATRNFFAEKATLLRQNTVTEEPQQYNNRGSSDGSAASMTPSSQSNGYVTLCEQRATGNHRTGNHLFMLAAMLYVAARTGRRVLVRSKGWPVDDAFSVSNVQRLNDSAPIPPPVRVLHPPGIYGVDPLFEDDEKLGNFTESTLALCGLYQTFIYADALGPRLLETVAFKWEATVEAARFFYLNRPVGWENGSYTKVGVHVRRGDFLLASEVSYGLTVATEHYLESAMDYFMSRHQRVQFIVATDDHEWTKNTVASLYHAESNASNSLEAYRGLFISNGSAVVTFTVGQTAATDIAILAACDASITSTGSFSWWAGWLTNKTTIYYAGFPLPGSTLDTLLNRMNYFPARWIPMT